MFSINSPKYKLIFTSLLIILALISAAKLIDKYGEEGTGSGLSLCTKINGDILPDER